MDAKHTDELLKAALEDMKIKQAEAEKARQVYEGPQDLISQISVDRTPRKPAKPFVKKPARGDSPSTLSDAMREAVVSMPGLFTVEDVRAAVIAKYPDRAKTPPNSWSNIMARLKKQRWVVLDQKRGGNKGSLYRSGDRRLD